MIAKKISLSICLCILFTNLISQEINFQDSEKKISLLANKILNGETDSIKNDANKELTNYLLQIIDQKKSYLYTFKEIEHISVLQPKDKKFKLFTWFIPYLNGEFEYVGILQICNKRGRKCKTYQLKNNINLTEEIIYNQLDYDTWYGCLYYDIIPIKIDKKRYYTLLGWDGNNEKTTKKIIDILTIDKHNQPFFGANIFDDQKKRILIEYGSQYPISLQYDDELEYIVFDHIEPMDGISKNNFSLYVTNLSYDILKKTPVGWKLEQNIYLNNIK